MFISEDTDCVTDCFLGGSDYFLYWATKEMSLEKATSSQTIPNPNERAVAVSPNTGTDIHEAFGN
jgi:hypothetical protein